jgi:hypothetical protein
MCEFKNAAESKTASKNLVFRTIIRGNGTSARRLEKYKLFDFSVYNQN